MRVTANFSTREDVYESVVKSHREAGSFNKLLSTLITAYFESHDMQVFIDSKMSNSIKKDNSALNSLLERMKSTISEGDMLIDSGVMAGDMYKTEVQDGYLGQEVPVEPQVGSVNSELEKIKSEMQEIKSLLRDLTTSGVHSGNGREGASNSERGSVRVEAENVTVETEKVKPEPGKVTVEPEDVTKEIEIDFNVPVEVWSGDDQVKSEDVSLFDDPGVEEDSDESGEVSSEESDALLSSLLTGGVFK